MAGSAFRIQRPNWKNEVELLLTEAMDTYKASIGGKKYSSNDSVKNLRLKLDERCKWAVDETYMQAVLTPVIKEYYDAELTACVVEKVKKLHGAPLEKIIGFSVE